MRKREPLADRFWRKVALTDDGGCWLWQASFMGVGYGGFSVDGVMRYAHRVAYELIVGPIPEGLHIDHLCRVRHCVNPSHLEAVTQAENIRRGCGPAAIAVRENRCHRGHEFTLESTRLESNGKRHCRTCARIARTAWLERQAS